ncbi:MULTISPECIES: transcription termination/antitermination protein NusG [Romboutsia]|uniref:Transcription termination/antitermination protein NusG n=1 Tax=Romboutsia hominis TaxID=1507512 RepID=A0A2P2BVH2_9FIRM|nr:MULTISPECIES: transcription termination/antitermination protein NusG [Romboutsia]MCH1958819.1 transcription termination/antitermination protein NusG [Romboutsia hominis]MCH1970734.1 transcription termination/antitermination protein NusG [Romboutsia hominis]MDB8790085.1 transcription termination/antitermination protein NusG [Romboutsia sp. 1001216sp1]MDB8794444.1 transcription termination/antitermination protein NusG [Romboutsia sp. 1001216sp1]MDB8797394.1 transcription termination/antitermi
MSELQEARWYVAHTYSGHENKVKATIEKAVKTRGMEDYIKQVVVPTEDVVETTKTGKEKTRQRKIFPGYVLVKMIITDESWYVVRNTKGVTGFVGPGSKPVPLSEDEVLAMGIELTEPKIGNSDIDLEIGDAVEVSNGPFAGQVGTVEAIDVEAKEVKVCIDAFGKKTLFVVESDSIEKL